MRLDEDHQREQYFYDDVTLERLADLAEGYDNPCCLCAPMVGRALHRRGRSVRVLDTDERFAELPGFVRWDIHRPRALNEDYDLLICDPPFFTVSLSRLFSAIRLLSRFDLSRRILVDYLKRREDAILGTFAPFGLRPTGWTAGYRTVQAVERNRIEFYANFEPDAAP